MQAGHNGGCLTRSTREVAEMGHVEVDDLVALLVQTLQHVVEGSQQAGYAWRCAGGDTAPRDMCDRFAEAGGAQDRLPRRRLAAIP